MKTFYLLVALALFAIATPHASGAVVITATQAGGDVVFNGAGTFDLSALTFFSNEGGVSSSFLGIPPVALVGPVLTIEEIFAPGAPRFDFYSGLLVAPSGIGSQAAFVEANDGSGDLFGVHSLTFPGDVNVPIIIVPESYKSGTDLTGTGIFFNQTFDTLGITPGSYTWSWGSGENFDSLTLNVIPEPSAAGLVFVATILILSIRQHR